VQRTQLVTAAAVVTPTRVLRPGWLEVADRLVVDVGTGEPGRPADTELPRATLVPGFVDIHVHGGGGAAFTSGELSDAAATARFHQHHGTTSMLASLVSAAPAELHRSVAALADLVEDGLLAGIHLEGPWLSPRRRGAHDLAALRHPDPGMVARLLEAGRGTVRMVTLAPELPGGLDAVRQLVAAGVTVAVGHTDADYDLTRRAVEAGATVATHLFNAMPSVHHREPGPVAALLEDPRVMLELVADGAHLHPAVLRQVVRCAGVSRVALVTDAMAAAGLPDGDYSLGSRDVVVAGGVARLADGTLAGSTATMTLLHAAGLAALAGTVEPMLGASVLTSSTPAAAVGLQGVGALVSGQRADVVALEGETGAVVAVMRAGEWLRAPTG
jgi:N-acetylglucosamine-6-phosphate deacetylase